MTLKVQDKEIEIIKLNTAVVGSGAAGFNAAIRLKQMGIDDVAIITEGINRGTSRNTGSDKQTYYKMSLAGGDADSPAAMARDLFAGMLTDGDNALCEAALSVRCFMNLCELGVEFPTNRFGEYVGYKTDHDPYSRATSVGPLTSKQMTEALEKKAEELKIKIYDKSLVTSIITDREKNEVRGLCVLNGQNDKNLFTLFNCKNVIFATGGPAGMYADSVFPECHTGSSGAAFRAGVKGKNLTEWQYGLASVAPRWNVSGTYMQVLPRFVSVDENGTEREFLCEFFDDEYKALSMVFLKGYQWPFDCRKAESGSSVIDLLVYRERVLLGRRVYLDFRSNPFGLENIDFNRLDDAAADYLKKAQADFGTPIERLSHMNAPAIELYREKGVDITKEMLEIALCAQHNNGGLAVDMWWQTNVSGLFAAGEVAGTHGVYRPGGSALNAGQVGSLRAAQYISERRRGQPSEEGFEKLAEGVLESELKLAFAALKNENNADEMTDKARRLMSEKGGAIRSGDKIAEAIFETEQKIKNFAAAVGTESKEGLFDVFRLRDTLVSQFTYLCDMKYYADKGGKSRGSYICLDKNGLLPKGLEEDFRFSSPDKNEHPLVQETSFDEQKLCCKTVEREVRPLPEGGGFFENVWRDYRQNRNVY